jgi:hypothetical protein
MLIFDSGTLSTLLSSIVQTSLRVSSGSAIFDKMQDVWRSNELTNRYVFRYILLFKSIAVMGLDIFTAITMISSDHVSGKA